MEFKDKIVVITGGAQGIGRCIAEEFRFSALTRLVSSQVRTSASTEA
jgi:NAD(P)-dependent dehydrogenase (short-subunit alcohol dehydrogenase family)